MSPSFRTISPSTNERFRAVFTRIKLSGAIALTAAFACASACTLDAGGGIPPEFSLLTSAAAAAASANSNTATITNIFDKGLVRTGALIGTIPDATHTVAVSLDGGAYTIATVTGTTWKYLFPTGAATWKLDSTHTITVRTTSLLGLFLGETTLTVYKGENRDLNRDGHADLAVGSGTFNSNQGRAYVFYGTTAGLSNGTGASANIILDGPVAADAFGNAIAMADVNGDGYADLLIGAKGHSGNRGKVYIRHGSDTGINTATNTDIIGEPGTGAFGQSVCGADVNGDGYADLIVGAPTSGSSTEGRAYVFHGAAASIAVTAAVSANKTITGEANLDNFGSESTAADLNADGFADVVVGADSNSTGAGRAYIFHGSATGLTTTMAASANTLISGDAGSDRMGAALTVGDFNGDGVSDLALGAFNHLALLGRVYIFHGTTGGITSAPASSGQTVLDGIAGSRFGRQLSAGDINGDGYDDLIVGANSHSTNTGRVFIYAGSAAGISSGAVGLARTTISGEAVNSELGLGLAAVDMNSDGYEDLLAAATGFNANTGRIYIFNGSAAHITATSAVTSNGILAGETTGDQFGNAMY